MVIDVSFIPCHFCIHHNRNIVLYYQEVMSIVYTPGVEQAVEKSKHAKSIVMDVCMGNGYTSKLGKSVSPSQYDRILVQENTIYRDMDNAQNRIHALRSTWNSMKVSTVYIHLADAILELSNTKIEHILCKMIGSFLPNAQTMPVKIIVTHDKDPERKSKRRNTVLTDCVLMAKKVLGARMMAMLPANVATPEFMTQLLQRLFMEDRNSKDVHLELYNHEQLRKEGYNLIDSVGSSSTNKPCMLVIERKPVGSHKKRSPCVAFVGKGITFDSGGLAIKPLEYMIDMKYDKIGAIYAAAAMMHILDDPTWDHVHLIGVFPFAENAISDKAYRPGDVFKSVIGKTVEIANPDAEGRLILADAFGHLHKMVKQPDLVIDIATLTGHADSISCWHCGYFYAFPENLKHDIEKMSDDIGERMIAMPTWEDYGNALKSNVADLSNSPTECGDAQIAAMFLKEFLPPKTKAWVHIDLAHETDGGVPHGHGIRTIISTVDSLLRAQHLKK